MCLYVHDCFHILTHTCRGLGLEFLRHIERTKVMCYVIDMAGTERQYLSHSFHLHFIISIACYPLVLLYSSFIYCRYPWKDYFSLREEVGHYNSKLLRRPTVIVANKMDLPNAQTNLVLFKEKVKLRAQRERRLVPSIFPVSGKMATDLPPLIEAMAVLVESPTIPPKPVFTFQEDYEKAQLEGENNKNNKPKDKAKDKRDKKDKKKQFKVSHKWKGE